MYGVRVDMHAQTAPGGKSSTEFVGHTSAYEYRLFGPSESDRFSPLSLRDSGKSVASEADVFGGVGLFRLHIPFSYK